MKTRFDDEKYWVTNQGEILEIKDIETDHLINIVAMFFRRPQVIMSLLIKDIENFLNILKEMKV